MRLWGRRRLPPPETDLRVADALECPETQRERRRRLREDRPPLRTIMRAGQAGPAALIALLEQHHPDLRRDG